MSRIWPATPAWCRASSAAVVAHGRRTARKPDAPGSRPTLLWRHVQDTMPHTKAPKTNHNDTKIAKIQNFRFRRVVVVHEDENVVSWWFMKTRTW
jgi:hypothetical protein